MLRKTKFWIFCVGVDVGVNHLEFKPQKYKEPHENSEIDILKWYIT